MQYVLSRKSNQGILDLVVLLKKEGFKIRHNLDHIKSDDDIIGICIDFKDRSVFQLNVICMIMSSRSLGFKKHLYPEEVIKHFDRLVRKQDFEFYYHLVDIVSKEQYRSFGVLFAVDTLKEKVII